MVVVVVHFRTRTHDIKWLNNNTSNSRCSNSFSCKKSSSSSSPHNSNMKSIGITCFSNRWTISLHISWILLFKIITSITRWQGPCRVMLLSMKAAGVVTIKREWSSKWIQGWCSTAAKGLIDTTLWLRTWWCLCLREKAMKRMQIGCLCTISKETTIRSIPRMEQTVRTLFNHRIKKEETWTFKVHMATCLFHLMAVRFTLWKMWSHLNSNQEDKPLKIRMDIMISSKCQCLF